jgi:hypothetical protein
VRKPPPAWDDLGLRRGVLSSRPPASAKFWSCLGCLAFISEVAGFALLRPERCAKARTPGGSPVACVWVSEPSDHSPEVLRRVLSDRGIEIDVPKSGRLGPQHASDLSSARSLRTARTPSDHPQVRTRFKYRPPQTRRNLEGVTVKEVGTGSLCVSPGLRPPSRSSIQSGMGFVAPAKLPAGQ